MQFAIRQYPTALTLKDNASMNIYPSTKVRPYVYLCIHRETGEFYIGYREKNVKLNLTSDIDFPNYKTSSKIVKPKFDDYDWYIIAEFNTGNDAYDFEQQLIVENWHCPLLLNKHYHSGTKNRFKNTEESARKNSESHKGKPATKGMTGKQHSELTKARMRIARSKQIITEETKRKLSKIVKEAHNDPSYINPMFKHDVLIKHKASCLFRSSKKKICPHCGISVSANTFGRWHGDKCKHQIIGSGSSISSRSS